MIIIIFDIIAHSSEKAIHSVALTTAFNRKKIYIYGKTAKIQDWQQNTVCIFFFSLTPFTPCNIYTHVKFSNDFVSIFYMIFRF